MNIKPIGKVYSKAMHGRDENWSKVISRIEIAPEYASGLCGLENFSHIVVIFWMHKAEFDSTKHLVRRPRDRDDMPLLGIFAQRAKHRPNPIGITTVRLLSVVGGNLRVQGLDAIDGTPILDIKPYVPAFDAAGNAITPVWINQLMADYF
jgi:tRNA-Thr(GGU) m(6)t(6)A37 methyltransferase TsaA